MYIRHGLLAFEGNTNVASDVAESPRREAIVREKYKLPYVDVFSFLSFLSRASCVKRALGGREMIISAYRADYSIIARVDGGRVMRNRADRNRVNHPRR